MQIDIQYRPANAAAHVVLQPGETVTAEGGAMISMSTNVTIETTTIQRGKGGILSGIKRLLGGENFFLNHFTAQQQPGEIWLSAGLPGDMVVRQMDGMALIIQSGSFVASEQGVSIDASFQGFGKAIFSGESMFWLRATGQGQIILNSFGAIYPIHVAGEYIVDTGHIVAYDESLEFNIVKAGKSLIGSFLGGEGLVCKFRGTGTVWCQSHNDKGFGQALGPLLKPV
ncbi:MAG: TIGR00266 family protein [Pedosphaera sp.]|nr:TIGR00266 family protein [Pedosphaera sp.]